MIFMKSIYAPSSITVYWWPSWDIIREWHWSPNYYWRRKRRKTSPTLAFPILASAYITELESTSASHMITAHRLLNPEMAFGTLFIFCSSNKIHKFPVVDIHFPLNIELFASHALVVLNFAF